MTIASRLSRAIKAFRGAPDLKQAERKIDALIAANKEIAAIEEKQIKSTSKLDIRRTNNDLSLSYNSAYGFLRNWTGKKGDLLPYGDPWRDHQLSTIWMAEPILAGAIYSMVAKMQALKWTVTGRRLVAKEAAQTFAEAAHIGGYDWGGFIASTASDFYTVDRGVFWETARGNKRSNSRLLGRLSELGHIDSLNCWLTGNTKHPMIYQSDTVGQTIKFRPGEFIHFASLPSPREINFGIGFSAVSRAYRAAQLLMGLHDYDSEKLSNLPPEGVAAVMGLTAEEFQDAVAMWMAKRKQDSSLTFPQVLWLIGSNPDTEVSVNFTGFSQIPESFDRRSVVDQYVSTLSLCFGVDAREFWPISSGGLGSASESEIQHLKAKGKGPGEFISTTERHLNAELPDDTHFGFDTQDIQEDMIAAQVTKAWVDALWPLYQGIPNPNIAPPPPLGGGGLPTTPGNKSGQIAGNEGAPRPPAKPTVSAIAGKEDPNSSAEGDMGKDKGSDTEKQTEQVLTKQQFMRLMADKGVLPDYLLDDNRVMIEDSFVHISKEGHPDDFTSYEWHGGVLKEKRLPPIILNSRPAAVTSSLPIAEVAKHGGVDLGSGEDETAYFAVKNNKLEMQFGSVAEALNYLAMKEQELEASERNIRGSAIPDTEAERGAAVTSKTLHAELERWRKHPMLSKYALTVEEEEALLKSEKEDPKMKLTLRLEEKSFPGHAGRPGKRGGSLPRSGVEGFVTHTFKGKKANPNGRDTWDQYHNPDGTWTKERQELHERILDHFFANATPVDNPQSFILGGGPASGKSTIVNSGNLNLPDNIVVSNADEVKDLLPEFAQARVKGDPNGAMFVHEESSYLSKLILERAAANNYNLVLDGTGDSGMDSLKKKIKMMAVNGQPVHGIYVTIPTDEAVRRSNKRGSHARKGEKIGRVVPESVVRETHRAVSNVFEAIAKSGMLASVKLFDNSNGPKLIAEGDGTSLVIMDNALYSQFLGKAKEW